MRVLLKRIVLLALCVAAIFLLYDHVKREREAANAPETEEEAALPAEAETQSVSVLRVGEGVTMGRVLENTEHGGIDVVLEEEDGTENVRTFTDVSIDSWYTTAVNFVVSAGLMNGVGDEPIFRPEFGMLRESFAAILYRYTNGESVEPRRHFDDVVEGSWYCDAVSWVTNERLMTPLETNLFGVGSYMTCEQTLVCLYRLAGSPQTDGSLADYPYAAKVSDSGRSAVDWAWKNGLITEDECVWYPTQAVSRAQVALLLMRMSAMPK
ncbi:MAG: S-layer homology domain-containing protein [Oscillospiraceae bacterium]|nr:S-layer homology domain-containing protein [Oscillospiraceae bacterium]